MDAYTALMQDVVAVMFEKNDSETIARITRKYERRVEELDKMLNNGDTADASNIFFLMGKRDGYRTILECIYARLGNDPMTTE